MYFIQGPPILRKSRYHGGPWDWVLCGYHRERRSSGAQARRSRAGAKIQNCQWFLTTILDFSDLFLFRTTSFWTSVSFAAGKDSRICNKGLPIERQSLYHGCPWDWVLCGYQEQCSRGHWRQNSNSNFATNALRCS